MRNAGGARAAGRGSVRRLLLVLCAAGLAGPWACAGGAAADGTPDLERLERSVVESVNRRRAAIGRPKLAPRPEITELARAHSRAMASGRVRLGHSGFDERAASLARSGGLQHTAENVSKHRGRSVEEVAAVALEMWLKSRSHRANLEGDFQLTGVGAARGRDGVIYLTQIFAAP